MAYFEKLNYTLSNEDTRVEYELLPENAAKVFSICGSGSRVLPLIAKNPREIVVVDLVEAQLFLCELRLAAARSLAYPEFLFFLGYRGGLFDGHPEGDDRRALFDRLELSKPCRDFWLAHEKQWLPRGFVLLGKWEDHFQKLGRLFRTVLRMNVRPVFEAQTLEEQLRMYKRHFRPLVFRSFLRTVANEYVFNKFLYKGHFSGTSGKRTESRAPWRFLDDEFTRLFKTTLVRKNYFLQILFLAGIPYEEGLPLEAQPHIVEALKKSQTKVRYVQGNLAELLQAETYDFVSLSDTISYLSEGVAKNILQSLPRNTAKGSRIVMRSFLRAPGEFEAAGWRLDSRANSWALRLDGTGVYQFHIYEKA